MFTTAGKFRLASSTKFGRVIVPAVSVAFAAGAFFSSVPKRFNARAGVDWLTTRPAARAVPTPAAVTHCHVPTRPPSLGLLTSFLDEAHPQVVEDFLEQASFGRIEIAARLFLQHADDVDQLPHGREIGFGLSGDRIGNLAQVHQRLCAETHEEGAEGDLALLAERFAGRVRGRRRYRRGYGLRGLFGALITRRLLANLAAL